MPYSYSGYLVHLHYSTAQSSEGQPCPICLDDMSDDGGGRAPRPLKAASWWRHSSPPWPPGADSPDAWLYTNSKGATQLPSHHWQCVVPPSARAKAADSAAFIHPLTPQEPSSVATACTASAGTRCSPHRQYFLCQHLLWLPLPLPLTHYGCSPGRPRTRAPTR